jgi:hypothetical protein
VSEVCEVPLVEAASHPQPVARGLAGEAALGNSLQERKATNAPLDLGPGQGSGLGPGPLNFSPQDRPPQELIGSLEEELRNGGETGTRANPPSVGSPDRARRIPRGKDEAPNPGMEGPGTPLGLGGVAGFVDMVAARTRSHQKISREPSVTEDDAGRGAARAIPISD